MRSTRFLSAALSAALLLGCETDKSPAPAPDVNAPNAKEKIKEAVQATTEEAKLKRDEYVVAMNKRLDELNVKYEELKEQAAAAEGPAREEYEQKLEQAKIKRDEAARKLDELKESGVERWEKVKEGVDHAFEDLRKAFE